MLWVPSKGVVRMAHNTGTVGVASPGTSVTTGAASNTKGSYASLLTTSFEVYWVVVVAHGYGSAATDSQGCLDIAVEGATQEIIIPDLLMGFCGTLNSNNTGFKAWQFPLYIPDGKQVWARAAGMRTTTAFRVMLYVYGGNGMPPFRVGTKVTTYGVTVPTGTTVVPGASGAEGAWTQITASTSEDHFALQHSFQPGTDTTLNVLGFMVDLGVGAATEEEIMQSAWYQTNANEQMIGPMSTMPVFQDIPSGTRLSSRISCSGVLDLGNYNVAVHGVS